MSEQTSFQPKKRLVVWLFNPFAYIAGGRALIIGLIGMLAAGLLGSSGNVHFDGVLDTHIGARAPLWLFIAEGFVDWLCLAIPLLIAGLIFKGRSFRAIDVLGTQALARWPMLLSAAVGVLPANQRVLVELMKMTQNPNQPLTLPATDTIIFAIAMIVSLVMIVWMVMLMYQGYTVSCNLKGTKAVVSFMVVLLIAETASKFALWPLYQAIPK